MAPALAACTSLQSLQFANTPLTGKSLLACEPVLPSLTALDLDNTRINDTGIIVVLTTASHIRRLSLRGCAQLSDTGLADLAGCHELEYLDVSVCPYLTL